MRLHNSELLFFAGFFFFKQKTAYEVRISDWSSDVCSSDLENRSGIFSTVDASFQQGMQEFLLAGGATTTSWSLPRADGDGRLILRCQRIDWDSDAVFGVTFFGSVTEFRPASAELIRKVGVTR